MEEEEEEEDGILEGAGLSMTGGTLAAVGERAEQEDEERGLLTGQSSRRTHTSSDLSVKLRPAEGSVLLFAFLHVPLDLAAPSSSLRPLSLDSDDADSTDDELPVRFHVPTRGNDVECFPPLPPPPLLSRFQVPVRLNRDDVTSSGRDGLSECERLTSCLLVVCGSVVSRLDGESVSAPAGATTAADSSSFLFSVGLGASLMKVDWRTSAGFSSSAFCFFAVVEQPTLDADSLLGRPPPPLLAATPCLDSLEADDGDAPPGDAVRGSCDGFPPFRLAAVEERDGVESLEDPPPLSSLLPGALATAAVLGLLRPLAAGSALGFPVIRLL